MPVRAVAHPCSWPPAGRRRPARSAAACSDDEDSVSDERSLDEVMAAAKTTLDETSGVNLR